jgi:hypothetical protein
LVACIAQPLVIPKVMTLKTLADVRTLMWHLPEDRRARSTWRYVAQQLAEAAVGDQSCRSGHVAASGADFGERQVPSKVNPRRFPPPCATGLSGCPLLGNCGHRLLFERDGSGANDPGCVKRRRLI